MVRYLLKRLGRGILTILLSVTLVFFIVRAMPSNPVDLMVSPQMSEEAQQALIEEFGLDQSKLTQYGLYMKELLHGNLGSSFAKRIPVSQYIAEKLPWTLLLLAAVMLIVILIGISVGLYAAAHKGKLSDRVISVLVTMGISVFHQAHYYEPYRSEGCLEHKAPCKRRIDSGHCCQRRCGRYRGCPTHHHVKDPHDPRY